MPNKAEHISLPAGTQIPNHLAIILDGNRRWARARGLHPWEGHRAGFKAARVVADSARTLGIHTVTLWGFSTENWDRSPKEIEQIMKLIKQFVNDFEKEAKKDQIRFVHLGRKDRLPKALVKALENLEIATKDYKKHILNIALDYGGKDEIVRATRKILKDNIDPDKLDEDLFSKYLDTGNQPYPYVDLFIRPSGEQRTSGLLPWQMSYAEIYWESDHLPDMTPLKLKEAILDYSRRRRRFGGDDKVEHLKFKPEIAAKFELAWWRLSKIPQGTKFSQYAINHVKEQYGLTKHLAKDAAKLMVTAFLEGKESKWHQAGVKLHKFYKLIKDELKLAFEPSIVASMEVKMWQKMDSRGSEGDVEDLARDLVAETYRISDFQAAKAAHLRVLATKERDLAQIDNNEDHWRNAQDYLERYYRALKDRVA
ncbi:MAG TPA: polyprenyl diphosphate synthase [Patescibacteria group bacterium]